MKHALVCAALAACSAPSTSHVANTTRSPKLDEARAYELGQGVPRDYARAAQIYGALCNGGHGSFDACFWLSDAIFEGLGVTRDLHEEDALLHVLCQRGDNVSCADENSEQQEYGGLGDDPPPADPKLAALMAKAKTDCAHGDGRSCELLLGEEVNTDAEADARRNALRTTACDGGRLESCAALTETMERCQVMDDVARCEREDIDAWQKSDARRYRAAMALVRACDQGDARACVHVPSKRVPLAARCAAHDYEACGYLGCLGDTASDAIAEQHNIRDLNCGPARLYGALEQRNNTLPPTAHVSDAAGDAM